MATVAIVVSTKEGEAIKRDYLLINPFLFNFDVSGNGTIVFWPIRVTFVLSDGSISTFKESQVCPYKINQI